MSRFTNYDRTPPVMSGLNQRVRQNVYMYKPHYEYLRDFAHKHRCSMSEVLRALIDHLAIYKPRLHIKRDGDTKPRTIGYKPEEAVFDSSSVLG